MLFACQQQCLYREVAPPTSSVIPCHENSILGGMALLQENPEYTFLFAGEGADYYHWVLFCHLYNVSMDQPSATEAQAAPAWPDPGPQVQHQPHIAASSAAGTMSALSGVPHVSPLVESVVQAEVRVRIICPAPAYCSTRGRQFIIHASNGYHCVCRCAIYAVHVHRFGFPRPQQACISKLSSL